MENISSILSNNVVTKTVKQTIKSNNLINENEHIIIGLSGGPDSLCLFFVLLEIGKKMNLSLYPVHINHKFRPGEAERDQDFVEKICNEAGYPCTSFVYDCNEIARKEKITSEEAGRNARYEAFAKVAEDLVSQGIERKKIAIAVAQNKEDQSETLIFRILRGTGTEGLKGIEYQRRDKHNNRIIRPLLDVSRTDIEKYCEEKQLNPRIDKTNSQAIYARNKIRLELIPYLEKNYNSNIKDTLIRMGNIARIDSDYLNQESEKGFECALINRDSEVKRGSRPSDEIRLKGKTLKTYHKAIINRIIAIGLQKLGVQEDITYAHYEDCYKAIMSEDASKSIDLPKGIVLRKVYDDILISREAKELEVIKHSHRAKVIDVKTYMQEKVTASNIIALDYDELCTEYDKAEKALVTRTRNPGDYIYISQTNRKKIQDLLVDKKIPKHIRNQVQLVTLGNNVILVKMSHKEYRKTAKYKVSEGTKRVILVELICVV